MSLESIKKISRRDFLGIAKRYGLTSTLLAAAGSTGVLSATSLARAAERKSEERGAVEPKHKFTYGAAGYTREILDIEKAGFLFFIEELEYRTNGAIQIEYIPGSRICNQLDCIRNAQQGVIDMYSASTQNSANGAPYFNVLDYAFLFPSGGHIHHFMYHPKSEELFRKPLRERHGVEFLYTNAEVRGIYLGREYADKPLVRSIDEIEGASIRATGSAMGRIALGLMGLNPTPVAWEETLEGLRSGLIDGAETSASAVAYAGMAPVVSQALEIGFFANTEHVAMRSQSWDALGSDLQEHVLEASYASQIFSHGQNEVAMMKVTGVYDPPPPGTFFDRYDVRVMFPDDAERARLMELCSPEHNPSPWNRWRSRLDDMSGGHDTYGEIKAIVEEIPADIPSCNVRPRRWWTSA